MNKEKWKGLLHLAAGLTVLYHGFDSFELSDFLAAATYLAFAVLYMLVAALHKFIVRRIEYGDTAFFLLEGITILYSAWHYNNAGRSILATILVIIGTIILIFSAISRNDFNKPRGKRRKRKRRSIKGLESESTTSLE